MHPAQNIFSIRTLLSIVSGIYLTVDKRKVTETLRYFAANDVTPSRADALNAIRKLIPDIVNDMPDTQNMPRGEAQRILIDWANQKIVDYIHRNGSEQIAA